MLIHVYSISYPIIATPSSYLVLHVDKCLNFNYLIITAITKGKSPFSISSIIVSQAPPLLRL